MEVSFIWIIWKSFDEAFCSENLEANNKYTNYANGSHHLWFEFHRLLKQCHMVCVTEFTKYAPPRREHRARTLLARRNFNYAVRGRYVIAGFVHFWQARVMLKEYQSKFDKLFCDDLESIVIRYSNRSPPLLRNRTKNSEININQSALRCDKIDERKW